MIKPPQELIDSFMEWYKNDAHSDNEDFYKDTMTKKYLESLSGPDFIEFLTEFSAVGGKVQSGGHRNKNNFRNTITENYQSFRAFILSIFEPNFKAGDWLVATKAYKYFGVGLATILLHRTNKYSFSIVNDKTKNALELLGITLSANIDTRYDEVQKAQLQLIDWFPELDNFYRADAINHFLVGTEEGIKLAKQLLKPNIFGQRYWICGLGEGAKFWDECQTKNIAVFGFKELTDISAFKSKKDIADALKKASGKDLNPTNDALAAWQIVNDVKVGDVIIPKRGSKTYLGYGIVSGPYQYDASRESYRNVIPVIWKKTGEWLETEGQIALKTLTDITPHTEYVNRLIKLLGIQSGAPADTKPVPYTHAPHTGPTLMSQNLILYGPPGTGKTYWLTQAFKKYMVTNSSETKGSYLARLVADKPWWQVVGAALLDTQRKKVPALLSHPLIQAKLALTSIQSPNARLWATLQSHAIQDCPHVNYQKKLEPQFFWKDADATWSVKEELLEELAPEIVALKNSSNNLPTNETIKRFEFVTFHQSYGYEEFVEGIRPVMDETGEGDVQYRVEPGIFKKICHQAEIDPTNEYAIFIDEINRGNMSKIFGELITLVELDKRVRQDGSGMRARLPFSKEEFGVPANLSIIGTMNTADRSIALIDIALRRRFHFKEMMPDLDLIENKVGNIGGVMVKALLDKINRRIEFLYDRDHMVGHSFFLHCKSHEDLRGVFLNNIIPLLQEYFYGDWEKICLVLGCGTDGNGGATKNKYPLVRAEKLVEKDILGFDHLDYDDCRRYEVNPDFYVATSDKLQGFLTSIYQVHAKEADTLEG